MVDVQEILIRYYRRGESIRSISKELRINPRTVKRYIAIYEANRKSSSESKPISSGFIKEFKYDSSKRISKKLTIEVREKINYYLLENIQKRNNGLGKQQKKGIDIHEILVKEGYDIAYSTVSHYITKQKNKGKEAFIKQEYHAGEICEFDWGEVKLEIDGKLRKYQLAVFTHAYSNYRYAILYNRQDKLCFADSHMRYFTHIGGIVKQMVYDNMRVAVKRFVGLTEKEPTQVLLEMANHYCYKWRFCNIRRGNEKGHVERSVEYVRRRTFSDKYQFLNLEEANDYLENRLKYLNSEKQILAKSKTPHELLSEEKQLLYTLPTSYHYFDLEHSRVDKYSTVRFQQNSYSVPDKYVGKILQLHIHAEKIDIYENNSYLCTHKRSYKLHNWQINIEHYLTTLKRKPGALPSSLAYKQMDKRLQKVYQQYFINNTKEFIELLQYVFSKNINIDDLFIGIEKVRKLTPNDISKDKIVVLLANKEDTIDYPHGAIESYSEDLLNQTNLLFA